MGSVQPTDDIFPVHAFDDTALNRVMSITGLFRFGGVLDATHLRDSLTSLTQLGDWKKLRGRLRLNGSDRLEIFVPAQVTRHSPAIRFRQTVLGMPIGTHPLLSQLAQAKPTSSIQPAIASMDGVSAVLIPPEWPKSLTEYVDPERDEPLLGLHVMSFTDATLVVLSFSHVIMDGGGLESFVDAWSKVLHDRHKTVPPFAGARQDPLDAVRASGEKTEPFLLSHRKIETAALMPQNDETPYDPDWVVASSPESCWRTISLSPRAIASLVKEATDSIPKSHSEDWFLSEDDIVTAWIVKTVAKMVTPSRPLNAMRLYDLRRRLSNFHPDEAYIQNAYQMAWTFVPSAGGTAEASLGDLACRLRSSLLEQTTEKQVVAAMSEREAGITPLYGDPSGVFLTLNSWTKMKIYQTVDFQPAVRGKVLNGRGSTPCGKPELVDFDFALGGPPPGPNFISSGKDGRGVRHIMAFLSQAMWPKMQAELDRLG